MNRADSSEKEAENHLAHKRPEAKGGLLDSPRRWLRPGKNLSAISGEET
jgi:hypothetical protein